MTKSTEAFPLRQVGWGLRWLPGQKARRAKALREATEFRAVMARASRTNSCWARTPNVGPPDHPPRVFALDADTGEWIDANGSRFREADLVDVRFIP